MLSRVAENVYWMSRYIERAENTARVIDVNSSIHLDLPRGVAPLWKPVVDVTGTNEEFEERFREYGERQVVRFMLGDRDHPGSVLNCLRSARENCRTVRDILPREVWEYLTELHLYVDENLAEGLSRRGRYKFLERIYRTCQMTVGLLAAVMTRDVGYQFVRLGRNLERADMTSRFIDLRLSVGRSDLLPDRALLETVQWVNVLGSLSAYQMYRRKMQAQVKRDQVLTFLLSDDEFPRSLIHCLNAVEESLGSLENNRPGLLAVRKAVRTLDRKNIGALSPDELRALVDDMQLHIIDIHNTVARMYFLPVPKSTDDP